MKTAYATIKSFELMRMFKKPELWISYKGFRRFNLEGNKRTEERNKEIGRRRMVIGSNIKMLLNIAKNSFNDKWFSVKDFV